MLDHGNKTKHVPYIFACLYWMLDKNNAWIHHQDNVGESRQASRNFRRVCQGKKTNGQNSEQQWRCNSWKNGRLKDRKISGISKAIMMIRKRTSFVNSFVHAWQTSKHNYRQIKWLMNCASLFTCSCALNTAEKFDQTALIITKELTKTTNCTRRAKKVEGTTKKIFSALLPDVCTCAHTFKFVPGATERL